MLCSGYLRCRIRLVRTRSVPCTGISWFAQPSTHCIPFYICNLSESPTLSFQLPQVTALSLVMMCEVVIMEADSRRGSDFQSPALVQQTHYCGDSEPRYESFTFASASRRLFYSCASVIHFITCFSESYSMSHRHSASSHDIAQT